jgi:hypothetical protein
MAVATTIPQYFEKEQTPVGKDSWGKLKPDLEYSTKICELCNHGDRDDQILLCDVCDDGYHMDCLQPKLTSIPADMWICPQCCVDDFDKDIVDVVPVSKKQKLDSFSHVTCDKCASPHDEDRILLCDGCNSGFHMYCLSPILVTVPAGEWFCPKCVPPENMTSGTDLPKFETLRKSLQMRPTKIYEFFKIVKPTDLEGTRKRKRKRSLIGSSKQGRQNFLLPKCSPFEERVKQLAALASALKAKGIEFSDNLVYPPHCPRENNVAMLETGAKLFSLSKTNEATFKKFKLHSRSGFMAPVMVKPDKTQGFVVVADRAIPDRTLLTEYVGDVDFLRKRLRDEGDSIMV